MACWRGVLLIRNAISVATGGIDTQATGVFGPTFAQFSAATVVAAFKHFIEFMNDNFHNDYDATPLDRSGNPGFKSSSDTS
jgi:hypothetical protein